MSGSKKCAVCETPISYADSLLMKDADFLVCRSHYCQALLSQRKKMPPALFGAYLKNQKKIILEQRQRDAEKRDHTEQVLRREEIENHRIHHYVTDQCSASITDKSSVLAIPTGLSKTSEIPSQRLENYRSHLEKVISEAQSFNDEEQAPDDRHEKVKDNLAKLDQQMLDNPLLKKVSDYVCGFCKGGCCANGGDVAYIEANTIKRYMAANPEVSANEILEKYLSCLGKDSITNACINQTPLGCCLPRELRSDVCNSFYCDPLKEFQEQISHCKTLSPIVVIQRTNHHWNRFEAKEGNFISAVAIVSEQGVELLDTLPVEEIVKESGR